MTAKDELNQYRYMRDRVEETLDEYEKYKARAEKMTATLSDTPGRTNIVGDKVGTNASIMADLEKEYEQRWIDAEYKKLEIEKKIDMVEEPYRTLLHKRYIEGSCFERIADEMGYTYNSITHMHGDALKMFKAEG